MKKIIKALLLCLSAVLIFSVSGCDSPVQSEEDYKNEATFIEDVDTFAAHPDDFKGKKIQTVLTVTNVTGKDNDLTVYATRSIMSLGGSPVFMLHYKLKEGEAQLKRGDLIRFFGEYKQLVDSTEAKPGKSTRVLECDVKYITHPMWKAMTNPVYNAGKATFTEDNDKKTEVHVIFGGYKITADGLELPEGNLKHPYRPFVLGATFKEFQPIPFSGKVSDEGQGTFTYGSDKTFTVTIDSEQKATWTVGSDISFQALQDERWITPPPKDPNAPVVYQQDRHPPVIYTVPAGIYELAF